MHWIWQRLEESTIKQNLLRDSLGASVLEIVQRGANAIYQALYTVEYEEAVFVLHCFKKKSTEGIKTPKKEVDLIHNRYKQAENLHKQLFITAKNDKA